MIADSSMENIFRELRDKTATADELAACLRAAMPWLWQLGDANTKIPGLRDLLQRSEAALKEYDK